MLGDEAHAATHSGKTESVMASEDHSTPRRTFRHFFLRGLAILLPTILTIWIFTVTYAFVRDNIAEPINAGIRESVIRFSHYPIIEEHDDTEAINRRASLLEGEDKTAWEVAKRDPDWAERFFRRQRLEELWQQVGFSLDLIGLLIAIVLIYVVGRFVGSYIGARLYRRGENLLKRMPVIKLVYPYVKQVTDFFVGSSQEKLHFKRVVAVEYPRRGVWSVGLVTGDAMRSIQNQVDHVLLTVFIPSSPTPFTGYVVMVREDETIELNLSIDQALKFTVSGGVLTPPSETGATSQGDVGPALVG